MVPKFVVELGCIPVAIIAVTLYVVVVGIDTAAHSAFGKVWREKVGYM